MLKLVWHGGMKAFAIHRGNNIICSFNGNYFFQTMDDVSRVLTMHGLTLGKHDEIVAIGRGRKK